MGYRRINFQPHGYFVLYRIAFTTYNQNRDIYFREKTCVFGGNDMSLFLLWEIEDAI